MADDRAIEFLQNGTKLIVIPVFWQGWELDDTAWIIEHQGEIKLVATNHGGAYFADESFLAEKLAEYIAAANTTRKAIKLLSDPQ